MSRPAKFRTKIFIDAMPIATTRLSGVGYAVGGYIQALAENPEFMNKHELILIATSRNMATLKARNIPGVSYRSVPLPARVWLRLPGLKFLPPIDLLFGRGKYLFTNFRHWPVLLSSSATIVYDMSFRAAPEYSAQRNRDFLDRNIDRWMKHSDRVITISHFSKDEISRYSPVVPSSIDIAYVGINNSEFYARPSAEIKAAQAKYDLPENYILYIGNIEPRKNLSRLVQAYHRLPAPIKAKHALVLIGGGGWLAEEIERDIDTARAAGDTIIRPDKYVADHDLPAIFSGAVMLAHPAHYEGFGVSPVQAMACGVPALVGNNSSMPEVTQGAALLVDNNDTADISAKIEQLVTDTKLRSQLIAAGRLRAADFSWSKTVSGLITSIEGLS